METKSREERSDEIHDENRKIMEELGFDENKVFIVLGCHRSGTSIVAKALHEQGIDMGKHKLLKANEFNKLGHYENVEISSLNQRIHKKAGGSWERPAPKEKIDDVAKGFEDEIKDAIGKNKSSFWGWKDPRNALIVENFLPFLEGDVYLVCVFRHPISVAQSIARRQRNQNNWNSYLGLVAEYNKRIINTIKKFVGLE